MKPQSFLATVAAACSLASASHAATSRAATDYVWFEAESATSTNFSAPEKGSFAPANEKEAAVLSGGKWMSAEGTRDQTLFLEYRVDVPASATYNFYTRKFWHHGPFRYKWDNKPWREVRKHALLDEAGIRLFLGANWVGLNQETLAKGAHTLRVELLEKSGAAAFDAWLLTPRVRAARQDEAGREIESGSGRTFRVRAGRRHFQAVAHRFALPERKAGGR